MAHGRESFSYTVKKWPNLRNIVFLPNQFRLSLIAQFCPFFTLQIVNKQIVRIDMK